MSKFVELRMAAKACGALFFETGIACKYGHVAKRYVSNGGCTDCLNYKSPKKPSLVQQAFTFHTYISMDMGGADKIALEIYLFEALNVFCEHLGKPLPINNVAYKIQWAKEQKRRPSECPV